MNRFRRLFLKDKYGVMRSCIAMCVFLLLCAVLAIHIHSGNTEIDIAGSAASVTAQANARLDQLFDDSLALVSGAAERLDAGIDEETVLNAVLDCGQFSSAYIESADGIMDNVVIDAETCSLQMRHLISGGRELVAVIHQDVLHNMLSETLSGSYEYELFNITTGSCLLSSDDQRAESFYDHLLNLTEQGRLEEILRGANVNERVLRCDCEDGVHYIALTENKSTGCGVSLNIPQSLLQKDPDSLLPHLMILAVILLLMAYSVVSSGITMRRIRNSNRNTAQALMMSDLMMETAARDGRITLLVVSWKRDGIFACHDGLGLTSATQTIRSISDLENICGMDDGEMDRVYECLNTLAENETAELTVHCYTANREDRLLRINFHRACSKEKNFLCSISDCTHERAAQYRAEQEQSYIENARRRATSIWQVNVSRNRWRALYVHESDAMYKLQTPASIWRDYSSDLGSILNEYLHPADYPTYAECMNIPAIASAFRSGTAEFTRDYRMSIGGGSYAWHRMNIRLWLDPKTNDILANFYIYNVDAKKNAELERGERKRILQQSMTAMSGIYSALYYVDLDNDLSYTARSLGGDLPDQLCMPYKTTFESYIDTAVHPDDREKLRKLISAYALKRGMTEGSHFRRISYRRRVGDGSYIKTAMILQPARFENGSVKEITLAIRYTDFDIE